VPAGSVAGSEVVPARRRRLRKNGQGAGRVVGEAETERRARGGLSALDSLIVAAEPHHGDAALESAVPPLSACQCLHTSYAWLPGRDRQSQRRQPCKHPPPKWSCIPRGRTAGTTSIAREEIPCWQCGGPSAW